MENRSHAAGLKRVTQSLVKTVRTPCVTGTAGSVLGVMTVYFGWPAAVALVVFAIGVFVVNRGGSVSRS